MLRKQLIGMWGMWRREVRRLRRMAAMVVLPPILTTTLYFLIFGRVIGGRIGQMGGHDYISFIAPGLIMMSMINAAFLGSAGAFFMNKFDRSIEPVLVSPMKSPVLLLGYLGAGVLRSLVVGALVFGVASCFTPLHVASWPLVIGVALLSALFFALAGLLNGVFAKTFNSLSIFPTFILTPLIYIGGLFYSISSLPPFWQAVSKFNPMVYIIAAFRSGFLGHSEHSAIISFVILLVLVIAFFAWDWYLISVGKQIKS